MARTLVSTTTEQQKTLVRLFVVMGVVIFLLSGWLWWSKVYAGQSQVFWGMIDGNLRSFGQTRRITQENESSKLDQSLQLQLGSQNIVKDRANITQAISPSEKASVTVETLSTPKASYVRYTDLKIEGTQDQPQRDLTQLLNTWGKQNVADSAGQGSFAQATNGTIPITYLPPKARHEVVKFAREQEVYKPKYDTMKREKINGRHVNTYEVTVEPVKYVKMLKLIDTLSGQRNLTQVDPNEYADLQPVQLQVSIDVFNRNLAKVVYASNSRQEQYHSFGAVVPVKLPEKTIPQAQLQELLRRTVNGQ